MRVLAALLACAGALAAAGCGVKAGDLFALTRTDPATGSKVQMVLDEEGGLTCDGGKLVKISDAQLVQARGIQEELKGEASSGADLPPRAGSVYTYVLRDEDGTLTFSDNSLRQTTAMRQLQLLTLQMVALACPA